MAKKLDELKNAFEAARKRMQDEGQAALNEAFMELFDAHPKLQAVRWEQYTPYFNDGEPCEFRVNDPCILFEGCAADDDSDFEDGYLGCAPYFYRDKKNPEGFVEAAQAVNAIFSAVPDELMEAAFGDHARIEAKRGSGFEIEEYEHD